MAFSFFFKKLHRLTLTGIFINFVMLICFFPYIFETVRSKI